MSEPTFNVTFYGIIQPGKDRDTVMENMARMFKTTPDKLKSYFAGGRKVIKSNVDELTAEKYRAALENVGLVIKLEEAAMEEDNTAENPAAAQGKTETAAATGDRVPATGPASGKAGLTVAEVGADVLEHPVEVEPQPIGDISDISMADVGADVLEHPVEVEPQPIGDISDISMAEVGADVLEHPVEVEPQPIGDISKISLAEAGADIIENPPKAKAAPVPDTSELSLEEDSK